METWPTTSTISRVIREQPPADPSRFLGVMFLPLNTRDFLNTESITVDQYGAMTGMIPAHDLDTDPKLVKAEKLRTLTMGTRYWKGASRVNESDILRIRNLGPRYQELQSVLLAKRAVDRVKFQTDVRMEYLRWKAMDNDMQPFSEDGVTFTEDYGLPAPVDAGSWWNQIHTADPVADVQAQLLELRGTGIHQVDMVINGKTAMYLSQNEGFFDRYAGQVRPGDFNKSKIAATFLDMVGDSRLRGVYIYDEGYLTRSNGTTTWTPFIPDNRCFLIGTAIDQAPVDNMFGATDLLGEFASTPAIRDGLDDVSPGMFAIANDKTREGNPYYEAIGGIYGMPVIYQPTWIRRLKIAA